MFGYILYPIIEKACPPPLILNLTPNVINPLKSKYFIILFLNLSFPIKFSGFLKISDFAPKRVLKTLKERPPLLMLSNPDLIFFLSLLFTAYPFSILIPKKALFSGEEKIKLLL